VLAFLGAGKTDCLGSQ